MKARNAIGAFIMLPTLLVGALASPVLAADLPSSSEPLAPRAPPVFAPAPASHWTGSYVGVSVGYLGLLTENPKVDGFEIGARAGYDEQFGNLVLGGMIEADASFANGSVPNYNVETPFKLGAYARLGYAIAPKTLAYGLGGLTFLDMKVKTTAANPPNAATGFGLGVGMEHKLSDNWSAFGEYRFHRLWANNDNIINGLEAKVGVNYRFGGDNRPLFARY
jgi:outer membrane immunogenic protein